MQAAAICREIHATDGTKIDLLLTFMCVYIYTCVRVYYKYNNITYIYIYMSLYAYQHCIYFNTF